MEIELRFREIHPHAESPK